MTQKTYDIFISYSRKDVALADRVCSTLVKAGISCFIDRNNINIGEDYIDKIIDTIKNSHFFLFLASRNAYTARYTPKELHYAIDNKPNAIIPYIIDNYPMPEKYKFLISDINYFHIDECPIETEFVDAILKRLEPFRAKERTNLTKLSDNDLQCFIGDNGKYGYKLKSSGEIVIPALYEKAWPFSEELARVKSRGKFGVIDKSGNVVLDFKYEYLDNFSYGLAASNEKGKWGFIDKNGDVVVSYIYDDVWRYHEGLSKVKVGNKWGFINTKGCRVIDIIYDDVYWSFKDGVARMEKKGKFGFVNKLGKEVVPAVYDYVFYPTENIALVMNDDKYGFIDKYGGIITPIIYQDAGFFNEGLAKVRREDKWGFVNEKGVEVIPCIYDDAFAFNNNVALVESDNECFHIDQKGNRVD